MTQYFGDDLIDLICAGKTSDSTLRNWAFHYLSQAFSLVPLRPNSKQPKYPQWQDACFTKQAFKPERFLHGNAGIACGPASGVLVLDVDDHTGFKTWMEERGLPLPLSQTLTVKTGKGAHFFFQYPDDRPDYGNRSITKKVPGPDVMFPDQDKGIFDVKGFGGYVVAPGSIHPDTGKPYTITRNIAPAPAPQWLLDLSRDGIIPPISNAEPTVEDLLNELEESQLQDAKPVSIEDLQIPPELKHIITTSHPVGTRSEKAWAAITGLLAAGVDVYTIHVIFEQEPIGEKHREKGAGRFKELDRQIAKAREEVLLGSRRHEGLRCFSIGEIMAQDRQIEYLVDGMLIKGDAFMLLGDGGVGKSLFGLQLAIALADPPSEGFLGHFPIPAPAKTLILQSENTMASVNNRILKILGLEGMGSKQAQESIPQAIKDNVLTMGRSGDLLVSGNFLDQKFLAEVNGLLEEHKPDLLFIDPLISFHSADENLNTPMRQLLDVIKDLSVSHGLSLGIVHHTGKNPEGKSKGGGRGASAIGNWSRNSFELVRRKDNSLILKHVKANDMDMMRPLELELGPDLRFAVKGQLPTNMDSKDALILKALKTLPSSSGTQLDLAKAVVKVVEESGSSTSISTATRWIKASTAVCRNDATQQYTKATEAKKYPE